VSVSDLAIKLSLTEPASSYCQFSLYFMWNSIRGSEAALSSHLYRQAGDRNVPTCAACPLLGSFG
jgi:hypothetical protein